ncbi:zinc finger protein 668-like [Wyeomyia smithii]|uniref:zinc finger protein 668-like n=1 Tax=Wyeomyia smithii TaxID=174621 RepID=UPI002467BC91|nr:zinc finger protein 668-like [Wyeomyia smithii]
MEEINLMKLEGFTPTIKVEELIISDAVATEGKIPFISSNRCSGEPTVGNAPSKCLTNVKQEPVTDLTGEDETTATCDEIAASSSSNSDSSEIRNTAVGDRSRKKYACEFCNKEYRTKCNLKDHTRTHTEERPFACDICSETFRQLKVCGTIRVHMQVAGISSVTYASDVIPKNHI